MAKKRVKKRASVKSKSKVPQGIASVKPTRNKIRLILKDLILFVVLTIISWIVFSFSASEIIYLVTLILAFISLAFLIVLLVLLLLKALKR
jgi:apolipoprotein N-acyltransferase